MNYYSFHIGDYAVHTRHLTPMEDLAYRRILDLYYLREGCLPDNEDDVARLVSLREHVEDVNAVLLEFFPAGRNKRADEEIAKYREKAERNREVGRMGGRPKKPTANPDETQMVSTNNPDVTLTKNQEPRTNNQEPKKPSTKVMAAPKWFPPGWVPRKEWDDFETMRRAMRNVPFTTAARDGVVRELDKLRAKGHDPASLLAHAVTSGHRTVYEPKGSFGTVNKQEAIEASNRAVGDRWLADQEKADEVH